MYRYIKSSSNSTKLPSFSSGLWKLYMDEGEDGKFYLYHDETTDISYEIVETEDGWNGNADGEPLIVDPRHPLYATPDEAISALQSLQY